MRPMAVVLLAGLGCVALPRFASAQDTIVVQYAAKVMCGKSNRPGVAPGVYYSAINVHNPGRDSVQFRYKFALTGLNAQPGPITPWIPASLRYDQAVEIECTDSLMRVGRGFAKGFLVIETTGEELDVVGVYTVVGNTNRVQALAIERVPVRHTILGP
jgi:hypothetical protein